MLSIAEARARVLDSLVPVPSEIVGLADAWGRVTATPVVARVTQPPQDVSAMDGFAVRAAEAGLGARLRVVGMAPAGHPWSGTLAPGQTVQLFTGSIMPDGADSVVIQEDITAGGDWITVNEAAAHGRHIRRGGQDFGIGTVLLPAGRKLTARDIGLVAAGNHPWVTVHRRPRIAILATGDEIALPGDPIPAGGIVSSNAHSLAALVRAAGGEPIVLPIALDDLVAIAAGADAARGADLLVTTGGASVGAYDLLQAGLAQRGMSLDFWKIAMRPGKPLMLGRIGELPILGLPGNPVSALVCAVIFLLPALARLSGLPTAATPAVAAILGAPLPANDRRADHLRATVTETETGVLVATAFERQDSAMMRLMTQAGGLILREPFAPAAGAGEAVRLIRLDILGL